MRKMIKRMICVASAFCLVLGLSACGGGEEIMEKEILELTKGNIDAVYLGEFSEEYLEITTSTEAELEQIYLEGLEYEAEYFAAYWGIIDTSLGEVYTDLDEDLRNSIVELYKEIYSHSKYEVVSAAKQDDSCYTVKVTVDPIDIMDQAYNVYMNDECAALNDLYAKYANVDFNTISDEDYQAFTNEYGQAIVQMVTDLLPNIGYTEQKSQSIQIELVDDLWNINEDDFGVFDSYVIYYP